MMVAYRANFRHDADLFAAFAMATDRAAQVLGLASYGIAVGNPADLVVVDSPSLAEAIVARPRRKPVLRAGRVVARDGVFTG